MTGDNELHVWATEAQMDISCLGAGDKFDEIDWDLSSGTRGCDNINTSRTEIKLFCQLL